MGTVDVNGSSLGTPLQEMLQSEEIVPGSAPSYELCKTIYLYHPLGAKLAEKPIEVAQSQAREITVQKGPETRVREAFEAQWKADGVDKHIFNVARTARIYGIASVAMLVDGVLSNMPADYTKLYKQQVSFNVLDPLNTSGSLVLNQIPTALDFQHVTDIRVQGQTYHRSRTCVLMNESPIYIGYTTSAFGYVGRSVYQRTLYPLKSFVQCMVTNDMVVRKAGVLIAKMKPAGSIVDNIMAALAGVKRQLLKEAKTNNVLSISTEENIETLNMQNLDGAYGMARKAILEDIASGAGMPAKLLTQETFAEGFGEGTEDAKDVAKYIDRFREWMEPLYVYFTKIVQHRAWNEDFYATIQADFPEYKAVPFKTAFYDWSNSFAAKWPSLLKEPDSELAKVDEVKLKAIVALLEVLMPNLDPENRADMIDWAADNFNELKLLFDTPLVLDVEKLKAWEPMDQMGGGLDDGGKEPKPFADSMAKLTEFSAAVARLADRPARRQITHSVGHGRPSAN